MAVTDYRYSPFTDASYTAPTSGPAAWLFDRTLIPSAEPLAPPTPAATTFWILWNENYPSPPRVKFTTLVGAKTAAKSMADQYGENFHVMELATTVKPTEASTIGKCPRASSCFICWPTPSIPLSAPKEVTPVSRTTDDIRESIQATDENVADLSEDIEDLKSRLDDLEDSDTALDDTALDEARAANDIAAASAVLNHLYSGDNAYVRKRAEQIITERVLNAIF